MSLLVIPGVLALALCAVPQAVALDYDESRAIQFAKLAGAAYCSTSSLESWSCGAKCIDGVTDARVCQGSSTKAFVAKWEGQCLLSFEGTSNVASLIDDLKILKVATQWPICGDCKVHDGFLKEWRSLQGCVLQNLNALGCGTGSSIRSTGHSLGAAINGLAVLDLDGAGWKISETYDFGMPRTGDEKFASAFDAKFGDRSFRVTHHKDPVPQVPPADLIVDWHFEHHEPEIFYPGAVSGGHKECTQPKDNNCAHQYWNFPLDDLLDHLDYMGTYTSIFGCQSASDNSTKDIVV